MYKTALPDINTGMGNLVALGEEYQVARSNPVRRHQVSPAIESGHGARCRHLCAGLVDVADQTTAVKTRLRRVAAIAVRCTDQAYRINRDVARLVGCQP